MESSKLQERAYGSVSTSCDAYGGHAAQGRLVRQRRRFLLAISGILCLVSAHCISGFVVYRQWHRETANLVSDEDSFMRGLGHGVVANLESSVIRKSVMHEKPHVAHPQKTEYLPPKTIRRDILDGWWQELKPHDSSLRQEGEAFLSAYKSVQNEKVLPPPFFVSSWRSPDFIGSTLSSFDAATISSDF